jgi:CRP-like cAMP-binding protein
MTEWTHWVALYVSQGAFWRDVPGYIGALLIIGSFLTRTMIPLRALSAGSNLCLFVYSLVDGQYPMMVLNAGLLPLNLLRLGQMVKLVRRVRAVPDGSRTMNWLEPYMRRRHCRRGQYLIAKGEAADRLYYIASGCFLIPELGIRLATGEFVGELGLLSPQRLRTRSVECVEDGDVLSMTYDQVHELFFQNPDFGFYFMRLAAGRLFDTLSLLERKLAEEESGRAPESTPLQSEL